MSVSVSVGASVAAGVERSTLSMVGVRECVGADGTDEVDTVRVLLGEIGWRFAISFR